MGIEEKIASTQDYIKNKPYTIIEVKSPMLEKLHDKNPFRLIEVDKAYIAHIVTVDHSYAGMKVIYSPMGDITHVDYAKRIVTINKEIKCFEKDEYNKNIINNLVDNVSYKAGGYPLKSYVGEDYLYDKYPDNFTQKDEYPAYLMKLSDAVKNILGKQLPTKITVTALKGILKKLNAKELNKAPVILSTNEMEAQVQLRNIVGVKTNTIYDDKMVGDLVQNIYLACVNNHNGDINAINNEVKGCITVYENKLKSSSNDQLLNISPVSDKDVLINSLNAIYNKLLENTNGMKM